MRKERPRQVNVVGRKTREPESPDFVGGGIGVGARTAGCAYVCASVAGLDGGRVVRSSGRGGVRGEVAAGTGKEGDCCVGEGGGLAQQISEKEVAIEVQGAEFLRDIDGDCCNVLEARLARTGAAALRLVVPC